MIAKNNPLDIIDVVTRRYIGRNSKKLVDNIFCKSPLWAIIEEEEDEFCKWARETREAAGIKDPPREGTCRGGQNVPETIVEATNFGTIDKNGET